MRPLCQLLVNEKVALVLGLSLWVEVTRLLASGAQIAVSPLAPCVLFLSALGFPLCSGGCPLSLWFALPALAS